MREFVRERRGSPPSRHHLVRVSPFVTGRYDECRAIPQHAPSSPHDLLSADRNDGIDPRADCLRAASFHATTVSI